MTARADLVALSDGAAHHAARGFGDTSAVVTALDALRLAVLAAAEPPDLPESELVTLEEPALEDLGWHRVELFGHQVVYGHVAETLVAGRRFLAVTEPAVSGHHRHDPAVDEEFPERRKLYNPNAVYALEPRTEDEVVQATLRVRGLAYDRAADGDDIPF